MTTEELGWAGRVMAWLRVVTHLVGLNLLWLLGTLAGLVVLGAAPASAAASDLLDEVLRGRPPDRLVREFWAAYRTRWRRSNLLWLPFWPLAAVVGVDLVAIRAGTGPAATALLVGVLLVAVWAALALAFLVVADTRYAQRPVATWRFAILAPLLLPMTAAAILLTVAVGVVLVRVWPVLVPLIGVSLPLGLSGVLVRDRLDRLDARRRP